MKRTMMLAAWLLGVGSLGAQTKEAGEIGRRYSPDATRPAALPLTSPYQRDRASFADVSMPASVRAIQQKVEPRRPGPVPFAPANLPDPFENRRAIAPAAPLPEAPALPLYIFSPTR